MFKYNVIIVKTKYNNSFKVIFNFVQNNYLYFIKEKDFFLFKFKNLKKTINFSTLFKKKLPFFFKNINSNKRTYRIILKNIIFQIKERIF